MGGISLLFYDPFSTNQSTLHCHFLLHFLCAFLPALRHVGFRISVSITGFLYMMTFRYVLTCRADFPAIARPGGRSNDDRFSPVTSRSEIPRERDQQCNYTKPFLGDSRRVVSTAARCSPCTPCRVGNTGTLLTSSFPKSLRSPRRVL
jgi:hypothetical protein